MSAHGERKYNESMSRISLRDIASAAPGWLKKLRTNFGATKAQPTKRWLRDAHFSRFARFLCQAWKLSNEKSLSRPSLPLVSIFPSSAARWMTPRLTPVRV